MTAKQVNRVSAFAAFLGSLDGIFCGVGPLADVHVPHFYRVVHHHVHHPSVTPQRPLAVRHDLVRPLERDGHDGNLRAAAHLESAALEFLQLSVRAPCALGENHDGDVLCEKLDALLEHFCLAPHVRPPQRYVPGEPHSTANHWNEENSLLGYELERPPNQEQDENVHDALVV
eukprot:CAMPEP_0198240084 /NCGR_PEP_ID=MMETSP1446-20131203/5304_2 /TAXON_ID=1461542 ORGANISM="Unidentified sp, Strain CCMP2111" /NCGR_SAMPLE_ID=MMETSP1446 /ASSEMBLY_ACC=CAM_ASM_001112 /LENGTH=172 /DNA_ID=CAMNT_0043922767 /DNA_START=228 /DNA_END=746 /DNA_ORIENTATION=-